MLKRFSILLLNVIIIGCSPEGLVRTPFVDRAQQNFPAIGISIDLPKQPKENNAQYMLSIYSSDDFNRTENCKGMISVRLHPFWPGQALAEPMYLLSITLIRFSPEQFEKFKAGKHSLNDSIISDSEPTEFQSTTTEKLFKEPDGNRVFFKYRKDIRFANGDVLTTGAALLHEQHNLKYEEEDKEAIKQILNSIKPLE